MHAERHALQRGERLLRSESRRIAEGRGPELKGDRGEDREVDVAGEGKTPAGRVPDRRLDPHPVVVGIDDKPERDDRRDQHCDAGAL